MIYKPDGVLLLLGGAVITVDTERRILDPGAVVVENDRIVAIDTPENLTAKYPEAETVDLSHTVIMPGLVDSHGHAGHGMTKAVAPGNSWLPAIHPVYFQASDEEFWRAESYLSALEHIEFGVTTSVSMTGSKPRIDEPRYAIAAASGYQELGLRHGVAVGPPGETPPWEYHDVDNNRDLSIDLDGAMQTTEAVIDALHGSADGRISAYVGPSYLASILNEDGSASDTSAAQMKAVTEMAKAKNVGIHTHAFAGQIKAAADVHPDILSPNLLLAHCTGISDEEIRIMAETGVNATHGPLTNAYVRARFPLIEAMEAGVNVVISTDGSGPDRSFDLLNEGRFGRQLQRAYFNDEWILPAGKVLEMMTIDAAKAIGQDDEIGSLEVGKKADIIALNLRTARMYPRFLILHRVVFVGTGHDVEFMMVDGRVLMQDRRYDWIDVDKILDDAQKAAEDTYGRADALWMWEPHENEWGRIRYR
jgi:5-methylthioadenosine/S-adenosylhomocysteine deaminase